MHGRRAPVHFAALAACTAIFLLFISAGFASAAEDKAPQAGLKVEGVTPTGQVQRVTQVVVRFSQAMHPVGDMSQDPAGAPLKLHPRPEGQYRWLDPQTLAYIFAKPVEHAASFTITVPAGATSLNGQKLAKEVKAQVRTPALAWIRVSPKHKSVVGPEPQFVLTFNQPVDLNSLKKHLALKVDGKPVAIRISERPGSPGGNLPRLARAYLAKPVARLGVEQKLELKATAGLMPAMGDEAMPKNYAARFTSFSPLALNDWRMARIPPDGALFNPEEELVLKFNNPVKPNEVWKHLKITPPLKGEHIAENEYPTRSVYLNLEFKPRTNYRVELNPGLMDIYGSTLKAGTILELPTGDLRPIFSLASDKGVLESALEPVYPLRLRNLGKVRAAVQLLSAEAVVPALVAEDERPWDQPAPEPKPDQAGVKVTSLDYSGWPANQVNVAPLDLAKLLGGSPQAGVTLLDLRADLPDYQGKVKTQVRRIFLQVTDLGLSLKLGENSGLVWVTRLSDGAPLAGASLELRDRANKVIWQGTSDDQGLATLPSLKELNPARDTKRSWRNPQVFLLARHQGQLAVLPSEWGDDLLYALSSDVSYRRPGSEGNLSAHALTQLPLYQPGQTVNYLVYLRADGPQGLTAPTPGPTRVIVEDAYGNQVQKASGQSNAYGSLSGSLALGTSARLGSYTIRVLRDGQEVTAGSFRVASFRPPDFKVQLTAPRQALQGADGGNAEVEALYHFGAPLAGAGARLKASQSETDFSPALLNDYAVGDLPTYEDRAALSRSLGEANAKLDKQGRAALAIPRAETKPGRPVRVTLEAQVGDQSHRVVTDSAGLVVHPAAIYIGVKGPYLVQAGQPAEFSLAAATYQNQPVDSQPLDLTVYREVWETVREKGPGGFFHYISKARRDKVWSGKATAGSEPAKARFTPEKTGTYILVAEGRDQAGRQNRSAMYFYASGSAAAGWQRFDDQRLELVADSEPIAPGQSARVMIKNPFAEAYACVTLERSGVRRLKVIKVQGPAPMIEVPVTAADAPQTYLSVLLVRGRSAEPPTAKGPDLGKPQVRLGHAAIKVKDPAAGLKVEVTTDRAKVEPGEKISARVQVLDAAGDPRRAEVTLLAVDERVLTAAGDKTNYDPRETFDRPSELAVITADLRTQVLGRRFYAKKGEDAAGGGGIEPALRQRFHPAVFWLAQAETDDSGVITAEFKLPDTLTAYRVVAVAAGKNRDFGLGRAKVVATRPLQVLSALPRFAVSGDEFSARVLVQNLSQAPGQAEISVEAQSLVLTGQNTLKVDLAAGQTRSVGFPVSADALGQASLTFTARLGDAVDRVRYTLEVVPPARLVHAAAAGALNPAAGQASVKVPLLLPPSAAPGRGGLSLTVAPSLAASLKDPASAVLTYPWDCLEQRMSKAAVRAFILEQGPRWGLMPQAGDKQRLYDEALNRVADYQTGGGGLTFWTGADRPNLFLTAYVLLAAGRIQAAGAELNQSVRDRALDYLERYLRNSKPPAADRLGDRLAEAMAVLALAEHGRAAQNACRQAVKRSEGLTPFGLAALMEAARLLKLSDLIPTLVQRLEATADISATEMHFGAINPGGLKAVMGSSLRGNAFALAALARSRPDYPRLDALARWVAARLGESTWISTQEGVFGLWGLTAYLERSQGPTDLNLEVTLGSDKLLTHHFSKQTQPPVTLEVVRRLLQAGQPLDLGISTQGNGLPHWTARLAWAPPRTPLKEVNSGFNLSRSYRVVGKQESPARPGLGDEVEVTVTVHVDATRHHVLVHDPFPAGLEPPRPAAGAPRGGSGDRGWVWQWRELHATRLLLYAPRLDPGVYTFSYMLRAVAPGRFVTRAAQVEEMYSPEVFGRTAGGEMSIQE